jgi:hypothetical protein
VYFISCHDANRIQHLPNMYSLSLIPALISLYLRMDIYCKTLLSQPYDDVAIMVTELQLNVIHDMTCGCETLRIAALS